MKKNEGEEGRRREDAAREVSKKGDARKKWATDGLALVWTVSISAWRRWTAGKKRTQS